MTPAAKILKSLFTTLLAGLLLTACAAPAEDETDDAAPPAGDSQTSIPADHETETEAPAQTTATYSADLAAAAKAPAGAEADETFITAVTDFSEALFRKCAEQGKNLILSPLSVTYALTLTSNGASGETLAEFNSLNGGIDVSQMNEYLFQNALRLASTRESRVKIANSIWADDSFAVNEQFKWIAQQYYNAEAANADFSNDAAAEQINQWVADRTDGMIDKALNEAPADYVMLIINTVFFDGVWKEPYPEYHISDGTFCSYDGTQSDAKMLYSYERTYFEAEGYAGFSKSYTDGYEFIAVLPEEGADVYEFAASLDWNAVIDTALNGDHDRADCYIPKFVYESDLPLTEVLQDMGLKKAFCPGAELSGLAQDENHALYISAMNQKAKIILNENGTKAAAYTEAAIEECEYPSIRFDRPFVYAIADGETGLPLFMGILAHME